MRLGREMGNILKRYDYNEESGWVSSIGQGRVFIHNETALLLWKENHFS